MWHDTLAGASFSTASGFTVQMCMGRLLSAVRGPFGLGFCTEVASSG